MAESNHYDVIIIGTGAGGGTLAYKLAPTGKKILILERGDYVPREKDNWRSARRQPRGQVPDQRNVARQRRQASSIRTRTTMSAATRNSTARRCSVCAKKTSARSHHGGVSPAWPISYDDLEPYYTEAERLYHVHGKRGEDPTEPPASAPYPHPAVSHEPRIQQLSDDFAGWACARSTRRSASCSTRKTRTPAAASAATPATASRASSTPSPTPRCVPSIRRLQHPTSRC